MNLREEILKEHSRRQALKIAGWIGKNKKRFRRLVELFLHDQYRVVQRSAYPLSLVADKYPELAEENVHLLVNRLYDSDTHVAVRRNVVRILQFIRIPKKLHAKVMNFCIQYLSDPNETVAVRCFSMTVLARLAEQYPEIKNEVELAIHGAMKTPTAGMRVRAKRVLKQLEGLAD
jgi:hypothetical protein